LGRHVCVWLGLGIVDGTMHVGANDFAVHPPLS
jgi:hypothetical protein